MINQEAMATALAQHPFCKGFAEPIRRSMLECARHVTLASGSRLAKEGEPSESFYLIVTGRVAIEIQSPRRGPLQIQTVSAGEIVGWSWLIPPHRWHFDARIVDAVEAIALDGACLRAKCESDHELGYQIIHRLMAVVSQRLSATRLQILDVFQ